VSPPGRSLPLREKALSSTADVAANPASVVFCRRAIEARSTSWTAPPSALELHRRTIRIFDYARELALPFRKAIRAHTGWLAADEGVEIEYIQCMKTFRKKDRIQQA
jgi:hypothetical protein